MNLKNYKHAYLIGIGGISVSAIAKLMLDSGIKVSGFDLAQSDITREIAALGADITIADKEASLPDGVDLVVFSEAVAQDDALRSAAYRKGIEQMPAAKFWGEYSRGKKVIAVSGTNGKSTTTALLGLMLEQAGFDPTVVVGTRVLQWDSNIRIGSSEWFVIEADEYAAKMFNYTPYVAVITNISADHLDYYKDLDDIVDHFQRWIDTVDKDGCVILNKDDINCQSLSVSGVFSRKFGISGSGGTRAVGITVCSAADGWVGDNNFNIVDDEKDWGYAHMRLPGRHNVANAVASAVAADFAGVKRSKILKALECFQGTWRRFEMVGECRGALIISDYAHHPDGIRATIKAAREWYPFNRIIALFQPHHHNRTKKLFHEFVSAFDGADEVIVSEIYDVAGREKSEDRDVSSLDLINSMKNRRPDQESTACAGYYYAPDLKSAESMVKRKIKPNDVVIVMGAGDVDSVARNLTNPAF